MMNTKSEACEDRRSKPRMDGPLPVKVKWSGASGKTYRFETVARNIGAGGLCAFAPRAMQVGERLSMRIRFVRMGGRPAQAPEISIRGRIVRVENIRGDCSVFAVSFLLRTVV